MLSLLRVSLLMATALFLTSQTWACTPSDSDFKALAASPSRLTPSGFAALSQEDKDLVCEARAFVRKFEAPNYVMHEAEIYSNDYLSADETARVVSATRVYLKNLLMQRKFDKDGFLRKYRNAH
jgi:hypothetical protein